MALTGEWRRRIENWRSCLGKLIYRPIGALSLSAFFTHEQLTAAEAMHGDFQPIARGTAWGSKWQYAWFKAEFTVPPEAAGERLVARLVPGGEAVVFVNGVAASSEWGDDVFGHPDVPVVQSAKAGERFVLLSESYAGHGPISVGEGPIPFGKKGVGDCAPLQRTVGEATFAIWEEDLYQAWLDFETLLQLRDNIDPESLRVSEIDAGLREFTLLVDLELPVAELRVAARLGRQRLAPLLACRNGSTAPLMHCFGHAHIDIAWLWPLAETERKCARTFSAQLGLMAEYPEYRFLQSQPHLYEMTKRLYPELYARILAFAETGQWLAEGGMWVEADTNITGGESLIRQFLYGKRFFQEEFGVKSELLWLPDVFGYSGALPQIMQGCGIKYFSTQKIFWNYNGGERFPYNTFYWQGIDGTRVLSHFHNDYNAKTFPRSLVQRWNERVQKDGISERLYPFGFGDGGGGPTRDHLEFLRREGDLEGCPKTRQAGPIDFFERELARQADLPTYVGELYYQAHRGTYTSQAKTKLGNRKCEFALREAEIWCVVAASRGSFSAPAGVLEGAWKIVLLNQFHDIIPGSSIARVYEEAEKSYAEALALATRTAEDAARSLVTEVPDSLSVFNSLGWARAAVVQLPSTFTGVVDASGNALLVQEHQGSSFALAQVPACGATSLTRAAPSVAESDVRGGARELENRYLRLTFDDSGALVSVRDKATGRELASAPCNAFRLFKDVPSGWDAWDLDSNYKASPVALSDEASIDLIATGPVFAALRITRRIGNSELVQEVRLAANSRRVDFITRIDWQERHKLLKVAFPVTIHADEAIHEIQFGHLRRPTHASRQFDADRFEVCAQKWSALAEEGRGVAILNDCKYGVDVSQDTISLTLLKSAVAPDADADLGVQEFTYSFFAWNGSFLDSGVVQAAYELNTAALALPGRLASGSFLTVSAPNVVLETVKLAEDGSGDVIVRLYESKRTATRCTLAGASGFKRAALTDMLEENPEPLPLVTGAVELEFRPFEIKTLRLAL